MGEVATRFVPSSKPRQCSAAQSKNGFRARETRLDHFIVELAVGQKMEYVIPDEVFQDLPH
jgi:hypothetical protein